MFSIFDNVQRSISDIKLMMSKTFSNQVSVVVVILLLNGFTKLEKSYEPTNNKLGSRTEKL